MDQPSDIACRIGFLKLARSAGGTVLAIRGNHV